MILEIFMVFMLFIISTIIGCLLSNLMEEASQIVNKQSIQIL